MASLAPSSPRLPSPPPPAEIQLGPKPPSAGSTANRQVQQMEQTAIDANSKRRIHPGTRSADMAAGPPLVPLSELDSAFQLQEHLAALHYHHTGTNTSPVNRETAAILATPPPGIDRSLWLYELCRFLIEQCNGLIVGFLFDTPPCSAVTCPEMRASEWQFLCAVHDQPKSCCAIDYCCHTLDWAANVVTNPQIFPSRFVALSDAHDKGAAVKNLVNVFRRLHRIFAHAWFQHRGVFWATESTTGLYVFFKTVCDMYDLLPSENYKLPPEAEGLEVPRAFPQSGAEPHQQQSHQPQPQQQPPQQPQQHIGILQPTAIVRPRSQGAPADADDDHLNPAGSRTSTRRHIRSSPSTGSAVTTVMEADEDDSGTGDMASRFRQMRILDLAAPEEDLDAAEVPITVEHIPSAAPLGGGGAVAAAAQPPQPPVRAVTSVKVDSAAQQSAPTEPSVVTAEPTGQVESASDSSTASNDATASPSADTPVEAPLVEDGAVEDAAASEDVEEKDENPSENTSGDAKTEEAESSDPDLAATSVTDFAEKAEPTFEADNKEATEEVADPEQVTVPEVEKESKEEPKDLEEKGQPEEPAPAPEAK